MSHEKYGKNRLLVIAVVLAIAVLGGTSYVLAQSLLLSGMKAETGNMPPPVRPGRNDFDFVPHKALYDIRLVSSVGGSQVIDISGRMFFKWEATCEAWITDHRFKLVYEYADTPPMQITSDFSTFEPFDGETFDFTSRRKRNGELYQEIRGQAVMKEDGGRALFTSPEELEYELPEETMFPMSHTIELVKSIREGENFSSAVVFDGSDEEGPVLINTFIGPKVNAMAHIDPSQDIDVTLVNNTANRLRMAFFPLSSDEEASDYEMTVIFHENGVISDMIIDYEDFTVSQKLVALEKLENQPCQ